VKYFTAGRHYRRAQLDLLPFRGRPLKLRFSTNTQVGDKDYAIDNVSVTYTALKMAGPERAMKRVGPRAWAASTCTSVGDMFHGTPSSAQLMLGSSE